MTAPVVGVLLPVRLETRFVPQPDGTWRVRVRVIPDAVAISVHDETPTEVELDAVTRFWREVGGEEVDSPTGQRALRALVAAVGFERAAWLARTFAPVVAPDGSIGIDRPATTRDTLRSATLHGLPPQLELWWVRPGGRAPERAAVLNVHVDEIDLDFADPDGTREAWWASFKQAVDVGLAAELDLGRDPDIDVLYVVGIGGGDPGPLLAGHADSGRLGLIAAGTPTSSIDGVPAASLGEDVRAVASVIASSRARVGPVIASSRARVGPDDVSTALGVTLPPVLGTGESSRPVNRALVGALWPALWGHGLGDVLGYHEVADPLGVWAADNLVPEGPLPALRIAKQPYGLLPATSLARWVRDGGDPVVENDLVPLVRELVGRFAARAEATAPGRTVRGMLRTPAATRYVWRWMVPDELARAVAFRFGEPLPAASMRSWLDKRAAAGPALGARPSPSTRLVSVGWGHSVTMPLTGDLPAARGVGDVLDQSPSSLLGELARHSLAASAAVVARRAAGAARAIVEPLSADAAANGELDTWALRFSDNDLDDSPAAQVHRNVRTGLDALAQLPGAEIERGLAALLDTATHRIDPWAVGIAWRRLRDLAAAPRSLGVYGWVDAPRPRVGPPSPEYVLAPSLDQAMVAAVLRDRAIRDPDADRWHMDLDSERVRGALRLADEVRAGGHPAEVLGRHVEQIAGRADVVENLRLSFPLLSGPAGLGARRVCDGAAVVVASREAPERLTLCGVTGPQLAEVVALDAVVDALADLHVAESVHGLVRGRPAQVSAATASASGTGIPSSLDVARTSRAARTVTSVAVVALPLAAAGTRPVQLADAAAAAYLDSRAGDPSGPEWTWATDAGSVSLAGAGLAPSDTCGLGADNLGQVMRDATGLAVVGSVEGHARVRALAAVLSGVPGVAPDVTPTAAADLTVGDELRARIAALRTAATAAVVRWRSASSEDDRRAALVDAARWGISPLATDALADRVTRAARVLEARVAAGPDPAAAEVGPLGEQIAALVAPEAAFPVLGRVTMPPLAAGGPAIDDWLETVAPVRRALARLEAVRLDEQLRTDGEPLTSWTSRPDDVWQTVAEVNELDVPQPTRLVVAYGPPGVLPSTGPVALGVLDRFTESVPGLEQDAAVAFRHDLPVARAPQAILLAVPPDLGAPLDPPVLVDIVAEARQLARARLADPASLGADAGVLHLAALSATGRAAARVD